jgi:hypothetical protein
MIALVALGAFAFGWARAKAAYWNVDDAGITFAYARSFAWHGTASVFPEGPRVEGYSNPLLCLIVAALWLVRVFDPITTHLSLEAVLFGGALALMFLIIEMGTLKGFASPFGPSPATTPRSLPPSGTSGPAPPPPHPLATLAPSRAASPNPPAMVRGEQSSRAPHATRQRGGIVAAVVGTVVFAAAELMTPSTWAWYGSGLENALQTTVLLALLWRAARASEKGPRSLIDGTLAFAAALVRPEGIIYSAGFFAALALVLAWRARHEGWGIMRPWFRAVGVAAVLGGLFLLWRYWVYRDLLPNTYYAKAPGAGFMIAFHAYVVKMLLPYRYTAVFAACAAGLFLHPRWRAVALVLIALLLGSVLMPAYKGNDWMGEHRFATPLFALVHAAFAFLVAAGLSSGFSRLWLRLVAGATAGAFALTMLLLLHRAGNPIVSPPRLLEVNIGHVVYIQGLQRLDHQRRLGLINPTVVLPDAGGSLLLGAMRLVDSGYLTDYQMARVRDRWPEVNQYQHQEQRADLADAKANRLFQFDRSLVGPLFWYQPESQLGVRRDLVELRQIPPDAALLAELPGCRIYGSDRTVPLAGPHGLVRIEVLVERYSAEGVRAISAQARLGDYDSDEIRLTSYGSDPGPGIERRAFLLRAPSAAGQYQATLTVKDGNQDRGTFRLAAIDVIASPEQRVEAAGGLLAKAGDARERARRLAQMREQVVERLSHQEWLAETAALQRGKDTNAGTQSAHLQRLTWDARLAAGNQTPSELAALSSQATGDVLAQANCGRRRPAEHVLCLGQNVAWLRGLGFLGISQQSAIREAATAARAGMGKNPSLSDRYLALVGQTLLWPDDMALQKELFTVRSRLSPLPVLPLATAANPTGIP